MGVTEKRGACKHGVNTRALPETRAAAVERRAV